MPQTEIHNIVRWQLWLEDDDETHVDIPGGQIPRVGEVVTLNIQGKYDAVSFEVFHVGWNVTSRVEDNTWTRASVATVLLKARTKAPAT